MERDFRRLEFQGKVCRICPQGEFELPVGGKLALLYHSTRIWILGKELPLEGPLSQLESEKRPTIRKLGFLGFVDFYSKVAHPKPQK